MDGFDGTPTAGRKGIAYDWRSVVRATEFTLPSDQLDDWVSDAAIARFIDRAAA